MKINVKGTNLSISQDISRYLDEKLQSIKKKAEKIKLEGDWGCELEIYW